MNNGSDIPEKNLIIKFLTVLFPDSKIYLFGSRARDTHENTSDVDLCIDVKRRLSISELARARSVIESLNISQMVDIVDFNRIPQELKTIILREGVLWKDSIPK